MIIVCQNCSTRLQITDEKLSGGALNVRCPKCKLKVNAPGSSPALDQSALAVGGSPSTEHPRYVQPTARAYKLTNVADQEEGEASDEMIRTLVNLLSKGLSKGVESGSARRKALVCTATQYRETIARGLSENGYQVYLAEDTRQAVETMRANQMDLVLLEPQFDSAEQGAAFVVREINVLRPAQRRRLFFALISPSFRTMDAHAAFLNNVNAVININDIDDLPRILEIAFRDYNELYRELNQAFNLSAL
jgi:predicted Zn finger-like uncharacterized protein